MNTLRRFLFPSISSDQLDLFRILFGCAVLLHLSAFLPHITALYSEEGYFSASLIQELNPATWSLFFLEPFKFNTTLLYLCLVIAVVFFVLGIYPRAMACIAFLLLLNFQNRNPYFTYGADLVLRHVLFLCVFLPLGYSRSYFSGDRHTVHHSVWALRVLQLQVAFIYLFAAIPKFSSHDWMSGEYVYSMLNYPMRSYWNLTWLGALPELMNLLTYAVLILELSFAFLVWLPQTQLLVVLAMCGFHLGIFLTYNVVWFSPVMMSILLLMLSPETYSRLKVKLSQYLPRRFIHA